eukprot:1119238-Prorocentrum_minimum.AAC.1
MGRARGIFRIVFRPMGRVRVARATGWPVSRQLVLLVPLVLIGGYNYYVTHREGGYDADVKGYDTDVKGYDADVKGYDAD